MKENNYPKLHNATWPGIVGKGPDSEPVISFDEMLELTAAAEVNGVKFDGVDIGLFDPHINIDSTDAEIEALAKKVSSYGLNIGSLVAPVWDTPAMGSEEERSAFVENVRKACHFGKKLKELGVRPSGIIRIDSASSVENWAVDPVNNSEKIVATFRRASDVAAEYGERLAAEGEVCWGGMQSWKTMVDTLKSVDHPNFGFQADMSHTLLYLLGTNKPEDRILPKDFEWSDREALTEGIKTVTKALRPWTIDFHVAQNDGTVHGTGSHDKTGRHCLPKDPKGRLHIGKDAGHWLRDESGELTKAFKHICWDGCMFSNEEMQKQETWNDILAAMLEVRNLHGWYEEE